MRAGRFGLAVSLGVVGFLSVSAEVSFPSRLTAADAGRQFVGAADGSTRWAADEPRQLEIDGADGVRFENIAFSNVSVVVVSAKGVVFQNCRQTGNSDWAIWFQDGAQSNVVRYCEIAGPGGIRLGGGASSAASAASAANEIVDTTIVQHGRPGGAGVWIGRTSGGNRLVHNDISGAFGVGISVDASVQNLIEGNLVHDLGSKGREATGIGLSGGPNTCCANTVFNIPGGRDSGVGIFLVEPVGETLLASNLVYGTDGAAYRQIGGTGVRLENNILSHKSASPLGVSDGGELAARCNIFYWGEGDFLGRVPEGAAKLSFTNNQFCCREGDGTVRFRGLTLADWQRAGGDAGAIECDALLTDPDAGNFRVRPDARAMRIGFRRFDPFAAGVRTDYSNYRYPQQPLTPREQAYKRSYEEQPPVTDDGNLEKRPEIRNGTWYVNGKPEYYLGVWLYNRVREWGKGSNPLKIDHIAYTERPGTNNFPQLGFNSSQLSCAHADIGRILHGARPRRDVDEFEREMLEFYRGFGDMPFVVDFAFGYDNIYPKPVRIALDQRRFDWHNFIPLCPEDPEGDAYYRDFFLGGTKGALRAGANVFLWELFNESAYNCECVYNRRDFVARMLKRHGSLATLNAHWGTAYATTDEIVAVDSFMSNPAAWYDWCVFSAARYNEILAKYRAVIESTDKRERVYFTEQAAGHPPVHRGMDLRGADALDALAIEGGWQFGGNTDYQAKSAMEAVVASRGSRHFYNCDFYQALAKGKKVIVNDEHYCMRLENGKRVPSKRSDYITALWLEVMHGVSANFTYVWDKRAWEYKDAAGALKNVEKPSYKSSSLLNPYNVKPEDFAAFKEFQDELAPYKEKVLPFPRVKPATVAVLLSKPTQIQRDRQPPVDPTRPLWQDQPDRAGVWYVSFLHALYPVKVVFEEDLDGLDTAALILPDSQYVLPDVVGKLRAYTARGGLLIAVEDALSFDAWGKPLRADVPMRRVKSVDEALAVLVEKNVKRYAAIAPTDGLDAPIAAADVQICDRGDFKLVCLVDMAGRQVRQISLKLYLDEPAGVAYRVYNPVTKRVLGTFTVAELAQGVPFDLPPQERILLELTQIKADETKEKETK